MTSHLGLHLTALGDELIIDLLESFAQRQCWSNLEHYQQIADKIIQQHLTVQFHAFVQQQISH